MFNSNPFQNGFTDSLSLHQQTMLDYLSSLELPPDLDSNSMNNNFDPVSNNTMDVDQDVGDVGDWLDSLLPSHKSPHHKSDSILCEMNGNGNSSSSSSSTSDPMLVGGSHQNHGSIFMLDDTDMCQDSIWGQ